MSEEEEEVVERRVPAGRVSWVLVLVLVQQLEASGPQQNLRVVVVLE